MRAMKKLRYNWISILVLLAFLTGCSEDFLERPPVDAITDGDFYKTNEQVMAATALLYSQVWFDYNDKASFKIGDIRGGTFAAPWDDLGYKRYNVTGNNTQVSSAWNAFFTVVGQANLAIQNIERYAGANVSPDIKEYALAEARFMRALAYRHLVMLWGEVPIIENNQTIMNDTTIQKNTVPSIWKFITNEMRSVAEALPTDPYAEGRLTQWSAEGMLARFYLTRAGVESNDGQRNQAFLDSAKYYADRVINMSGKSLLPEYEDLFKYPYDNNNESLFELQWVYSADVWGVSNSAPAYFNYSSEIANGDGWGGAYGASWWVLNQYEGFEPTGASGDTIKGTPRDKRLKETFMLPGFEYPEITRTYTNEEGETVSEDLVFPNNYNDQSFANCKKYVCGKAVDMDGKASSQHYPNNTYMMRLAEMYLIYAEATLGNQETSSDAQALEYLNAIRKRAGVGMLQNEAGTGAATSFTFDDIFRERVLEFAMESMCMYDISRLYYYDKQKALDILNSQDRGMYGIYTDKYPDPTEWTIVKTSWDEDRHVTTVTEGNFYLPIPNVELSAAPNLQKPAVDYYEQNN
ncbi:MAG: starch-binding outer membrane protein SusD/RagB family [Anaerophaga sp.]|nr:starch-binding outer membrane protein SusD/RagB family [Anaerophaga sp.]